MTRRLMLAAGLVVLAVAAVAAVAIAGPGASSLAPVPANTRSTGYSPATTLSAGLAQIVVAQGSNKLDGGTAAVPYYGYDGDSPFLVASTATGNIEAHKTEPDKNTYLVFKDSLKGADTSYDYGTHFLFQGHETGSPGYITRINLDADAAHRVTLLATQDVTGANIADIDGSTWDPWAKRLLFTTENASAPTYSATPDYPSQVVDVSGALGRGGYEGIQNDGDGNIWIVEDIGGSNKPGTTAKIPNSFVYRYVPAKPGDLAHGKLQVLQVLNDAGQPITFESQTPFRSPDQIALHTYGKTFDTKWITIHDTAVSNAPFNANTAAKAAHGTPFKRPENGLFRPDSHFKEFYFDETGDTNATSTENDLGGWTGVFKLVQSDPSANTGKLSLF
ncbi:MAG: alkaline phosphatase PhoX, partial [Gaiellaceae bacterium]